MITDKQLDDVRLKLPDGWNADVYGIGISSCVVIHWPDHGFVTVDFKARGFRSGMDARGPLALPTLHRELVKLNPDFSFELYRGRGWQDRLVADAVAYLQGVYAETPLAGTPADRKLALDVARCALSAVRTPEGESDGHAWCYFAEETDSWWAVTAEAMLRLADLIQQEGPRTDDVQRRIIEEWAATDSGAVELSSGTSRKLSREHGK